MVKINSHGFSIISSLISLALTGAAMMAFVSMRVAQEKEAKAIQRRLSRASLQFFLTRVMMDEESCSCHFDSSLNTSASPGTSFEVDTNSPEDIDLGSVRRGCDFNSLDNILVEVGQGLPGESSLVVEEIKVSNLAPTGSEDQYSGDLTVSYSNQEQGSVSRPISIPLIFALESAGGGRRSIQSCWGDDSSQASVDDSCYKVEGGGSVQESTRVGCGGTIDVLQDKRVSLGFESGLSRGLHGRSVYLGYQAGRNHTASRSVFLGYQAGQDSQGISNTFIGYRSGWDTDGEEQVFIGHKNAQNRNDRGSTPPEQDNILIGEEAGEHLQTGGNILVGYRAGRAGRGRGFISIGAESGLRSRGSTNIFVGTHAGKSDERGFENIFLGQFAGEQNVSSRESVFIGEGAGRESRGGKQNVAIGILSGRKLRGEGNVFVGSRSGYNSRDKDNVFVGSSSGELHQTGQWNTFLGFQSGYKQETSTGNVLVGWKAGWKLRDGDFNTLIGADVSNWTERGDYNIFIGEGAGGLARYREANNKFVVGTSSHKEWLTGDISSSGNLYVNGAPVSLTSSRALKKNIQPVKNLESYLMDVVRTPLFTYHYKNKADHPQKQRMGIISEELPESLQLKREGYISQPDWPSIYGSFWASLKALYKILENLRRDIFLQVEAIAENLEKLEAGTRGREREISDLERNLLRVGSRTDQSHRKLEEVQQELLSLRIDVERRWREWERNFRKVSLREGVK